MNAIRYLPFVGPLLIGLPFAMSGLGELGRLRSDDRDDCRGRPAGTAACIRGCGCRRTRRRDSC